MSFALAFLRFLRIAPRTEIGRQQESILLISRNSAHGLAFTNATRIFFPHMGFLYLIAARHMVINEATSFLPNQLQLSRQTNPADLPRLPFELLSPMTANW